MQSLLPLLDSNNAAAAANAASVTGQPPSYWLQGWCWQQSQNGSRSSSSYACRCGCRSRWHAGPPHIKHSADTATTVVVTGSSKGVSPRASLNTGAGRLSGCSAWCMFREQQQPPLLPLLQQLHPL
jgi:hypothetical protein